MKVRFEGFGQASAFAEKDSKGPDKERWVLKSIDGGLHYSVIQKLEHKFNTDKILAHYKDGQIVK